MPGRMTVYLDDELLERARRFIPARGLSRFINDLLAERIAQLEQEALEQAMREGYEAAQSERKGINTDWEVTDTEGWPA